VTYANFLFQAWVVGERVLGSRDSLKSEQRGRETVEKRRGIAGREEGRGEWVEMKTVMRNVTV
jgi:hypothetical protein